MKIVELRVSHVQIPLKRKFRHARAERSETENIIVEIYLADGTCGIGEGVPREYVTGETPSSVFQQLKGIDREYFKQDIPDAPTLRRFLSGIVLPGDESGQNTNVAHCALELSLLDAFSQCLQSPITEILAPERPQRNRIPSRDGIPHACCSRKLCYSAVISMTTPGRAFFSALPVGLFGFRHIKVKVGADPVQDIATIARIRKMLGKRVDLRVDVNGAWSIEQAIDMMRKMEPYGISAVEQPVSVEETPQLGEVRAKSSIPIILDESLCTIADAQRAIDGGLCDAFNIRVSKCGGLRRSLEIAQMAVEHDIAFQLGCQVGETSVLSAAGRHFAALAPDILYAEGSYDRFLLSKRVTTHSMGFGYGGVSKTLRGLGLGVSLDESRLRDICQHCQTISFR